VVVVERTCYRYRDLRVSFDLLIDIFVDVGFGRDAETENEDSNCHQLPV
jgi:hypothetical protein